MTTLLITSNPPEWEPDNATTTCRHCKTNFSFFVRRHHCRQCGKVHCSSCTAFQTTLPGWYGVTPVRVCYNCFNSPPPVGALAPTDPRRVAVVSSVRGSVVGAAPSAATSTTMTSSQLPALSPYASQSQPPAPDPFAMASAPPASAPPAQPPAGSADSLPSLPMYQSTMPTSTAPPPPYGSAHHTTTMLPQNPMYASAMPAPNGMSSMPPVYGSTLAASPGGGGAPPPMAVSPSFQPPFMPQAAPYASAMPPPNGMSTMPAPYGSSAMPPPYPSAMPMPAPYGSSSMLPAPAPPMMPVPLEVQDLSAPPPAYGSTLPPEYPSENDIRDTFYEAMVDQATSGEGLITLQMLQHPSPEVKLLLSACALIEMLASSQGTEGGLTLLRGKALRPSNCPPAFADFTGGMMKLKEPIARLTHSQRLQLKAECATVLGVRRASTAGKFPQLVQPLVRVAGMLSQRDVFVRVVDNVLAYALQVVAPDGGASAPSAVAHQAPPQAQRAPPPAAAARSSESSRPASGSFKGISEDTVRDTFYSIMFEQATSSGLFKLEALIDHDPYIFLALSAHALIELVMRSAQVAQGIVLANNSVMTESNCPPTFRAMLHGLLGFKSAFASLSQEQILVIKYSSIDDHDLPMPSHLYAWRTPAVMELASRINGVASQISQRSEFHTLIASVIDLAVDCLRSK